MKLKKLLAFTVLGLCMQPVFADGQVKGNLFAAGVALSIGTHTNVSFLMVDPESTDYVDWDEDPGDVENTGYDHDCIVPYFGYPVMVDTSTEAGKQAMALAASANATGQEVIVKYTTETDSEFPSGVSCHLALIAVAGTVDF